MHGISPQQFAESVSSFLVPFYVALAAMNGIAALLMWQKFEPMTYFRKQIWRYQSSRYECARLDARGASRS